MRGPRRVAGIAGGVLIASLAIVAFRTSLLPKWLAVLGVIVAIVSVPAATLGMWIIVESVWLALAAVLLRPQRDLRPTGSRFAVDRDAAAVG